MDASRLLLGLLAPRGRAAPLAVLIFHRVLAAPDPLLPGEPTREEFAHRMRWLRDRFNVLPLGDAAQRLARGALPPRAVSITFDDGYADNCTLARPVLRELGLPATFFVATGFLDGGIMFNDVVIEAIRGARASALDVADLGLGRWPLTSDAERVAAIDRLLVQVKHKPPAERLALVERIAERCAVTPPRDLMMTSAQLAAMAAEDGVEIGGHTVTHPILARTDPDAARREIAGGRDRLAAITGRRIGLFAYPNGRPGEDYGAEHVAMVRSLGFDAAVSTAWGASAPGDDPFQIRRFTPWDRGDLAYGLRMVRNMRSGGHALV